MDSDMYLERLAEIQLESNRSSDARIDRVNNMMNNMVIITEKLVVMLENCQRATETQNKQMIAFLETMRTTYDTHIKSVEQARDKAAEALLMEQQHTSKLIDKLTHAGVHISGVGNTEIKK